MDATTHRRYGPLFRRALARPVVGGGEEVTAAAARRELDRLADACVRTEGGVAPGPYLAPVVEAAVLRVLFGLQRDDESWAAFQAEYRSLEEQPLASPLTRAARESLPLLRDILREHQARLASHEGTRVCSLTELARIDPAMPDDVCLDNLLFAHRLSAASVCSLLTWLLYELGRNPGVIGRLREEIDTPERAAAAPLVERTIMETLRLNQSEYLFRTVTDEFEFEGFRFPRSWQVRLCVWESHRDPDVFEQPESFDPDRFLGRDFTSAEYSPFGWGAHACNGVALTEMICRTVLVTLVSGFELEVHGGDPAEHGSRHWNHWQPNSDLRLRLVPLTGAVRRGAEGGLVVMPAGVPELTRVDAS